MSMNRSLKSINNVGPNERSWKNIPPTIQQKQSFINPLFKSFFIVHLYAVNTTIDLDTVPRFFGSSYIEKYAI